MIILSGPRTKYNNNEKLHELTVLKMKWKTHYSSGPKRHRKEDAKNLTMYHFQETISQLWCVAHTLYLHPKKKNTKSNISIAENVFCAVILVTCFWKLIFFIPLSMNHLFSTFIQYLTPRYSMRERMGEDNVRKYTSSLTLLIINWVTLGKLPFFLGLGYLIYINLDNLDEDD